MAAYYNEIDPYAAQWLRNLIVAGHIAPGDVDERSIKDVNPDDLKNYTQCHFFAGIGVWSYALRLAGWPDARPVWTGSCPCQPFSAAGKGAGFDDSRHLWPDFFRLISQCRPPIVFGEQVASAVGFEWLDLVQADLETAGYACGAADLCAAGVGAPHIRQRLYFVADADYERLERRRESERKCGAKWASGAHSVAGRLAQSDRRELGRLAIVRGNEPHGEDAGRSQGGGGAAACGDVRRLADDASIRREMAIQHAGSIGSSNAKRQTDVAGGDSTSNGTRPIYGHWADADWLYCRDGKWRPVESGTFPLAHGAAARVGRLRAYGNAIVPQVAQAFIEAYLET